MVSNKEYQRRIDELQQQVAEKDRRIKEAERHACEEKSRREKAESKLVAEGLEISPIEFMDGKARCRFHSPHS